MNSQSETDPYRQILVSTPDICFGCHSTVLRASHLGRAVASGEISLEDARQEYVESFESCKFGLVVHENAKRVPRCGDMQLCGTFVRGVNDKERELAAARFGLVEAPVIGFDD